MSSKTYQRKPHISANQLQRTTNGSAAAMQPNKKADENSMQIPSGINRLPSKKPAAPYITSKVRVPLSEKNLNINPGSKKRQVDWFSDDSDDVFQKPKVLISRASNHFPVKTTNRIVPVTGGTRNGSSSTFAATNLAKKSLQTSNKTRIPAFIVTKTGPHDDSEDEASDDSVFEKPAKKSKRQVTGRSRIGSTTSAIAPAKNYSTKETTLTSTTTKKAQPHHNSENYDDDSSSSEESSSDDSGVNKSSSSKSGRQMPTTRLVMEYDSESDGDDEEEDQLANSGVDDDSSDEVQVQRMPRDNRRFSLFLQEEDLVEVVRKYTKFPAGSDVDIKTNGELWIAGQKKDVVISEATKSVMISAGIWGKKLTIGKRGYVTVGTNFSKVVHTIVAASRKDSDFHDLLQSGYSCQKDELEVLHLDDCPYNFNVDNLQWNTHAANMFLKLTYGTRNGSKHQASTSINGKNEQGTTCSTLLEARHAVDILKINNVPEHLKDLVFKHGMNFKYPNLETLLKRAHQYKTEPSHQGKPRKSRGTTEIVHYETNASDGLKEAVLKSKIPFDSVKDVLVQYTGGSKKVHTFIVEKSDYQAHILNKQAMFSVDSDGYIKITSLNQKTIGLHRLVKGLVVGDGKVARHKVEGKHGLLDLRERVLRKGNHASNMRDRDRKTAASTSKYAGVSWHKKSQKYRAHINFSNDHVKYYIHLGCFGTKGDKSTTEREAPGETEAGARYALVSANVDRINELLKNIPNRKTFIKLVKEEVAKL